MSTITTALVTPDLWGDIQHALTGGGDGATCQCVWPLMRGKDWKRTTRTQREEVFHQEIDRGPAPGLLAFVDGEAAGWIRIGPRPELQRIRFTRAIAAATQEDFEDESVWAVTCFVVRREHRRAGLNTVLLHAAIDHARASGARVVEAYPVDTARGTRHPNELFHGTASTFERAGFIVVGELTQGRVLVTRHLPG
jgi:GNAT superfamily N-acetyltransferase